MNSSTATGPHVPVKARPSMKSSIQTPSELEILFQVSGESGRRRRVSDETQRAHREDMQNVIDDRRDRVHPALKSNSNP